MKAVRYLLIAIVAIVMLAVLAVAIAMAVIDPNDYKPQIEQAVERQTRLDLQLEGDIGWSLLPLGLELNDVNATLEGQRFVALRQLIAQVDLWSLITLSPRVHTFVLDGLEANLEVNAQGEGNWTRIMKPESGAPPLPPRPPPEPTLRSRKPASAGRSTSTWKTWKSAMPGSTTGTRRLASRSRWTASRSPPVTSPWAPNSRWPSSSR